MILVKNGISYDLTADMLKEVEEDWSITSQQLKRDLEELYKSEIRNIYIMPNVNEYPILAFFTAYQEDTDIEEEASKINIEDVTCTQEEIDMLYKLQVL